MLGASPTVAYRRRRCRRTPTSEPEGAQRRCCPATSTRRPVWTAPTSSRVRRRSAISAWRTALAARRLAPLRGVRTTSRRVRTRRVGQRREQAAYLAAIVAALGRPTRRCGSMLGRRPERVPAAGRPARPGEAEPSDQLAPLYDLGLRQPLGRAGGRGARRRRTRTSSRVRRRRWTTCSSPRAWTTTSMRVRAAHINADWPAEFAGDGARGAWSTIRSSPVTTCRRPSRSCRRCSTTTRARAWWTRRRPRSSGAAWPRRRRSSPTATGRRIARSSRRSSTQLRNKTPQSVDPVAAAQLISEAQRLLAA